MDVREGVCEWKDGCGSTIRNRKFLLVWQLMLLVLPHLHTQRCNESVKSISSWQLAYQGLQNWCPHVQWPQLDFIAVCPSQCKSGKSSDTKCSIGNRQFRIDEAISGRGGTLCFGRWTYARYIHHYTTRLFWKSALQTFTCYPKIYNLHWDGPSYYSLGAVIRGFTVINQTR